MPGPCNEADVELAKAVEHALFDNEARFFAHRDRCRSCMEAHEIQELCPTGEALYREWVE